MPQKTITTATTMLNLILGKILVLLQQKQGLRLVNGVTLGKYFMIRREIT